MMFFVIIGSFFLIFYIDSRLFNIMKNNIDIEVERITSNIVNSELNKLNVEDNYDSFIDVFKSPDGKIENISYNTRKINEMSGIISSNVQETLFNLDNGDISSNYVFNRVENSKFKNIKKGVLCCVSLGSIKKSTLFSSIGPCVPVKISFIGQVNTDIDVNVHEYGLNNVMVEISLVINIKEQSSIPLISSEKDVIVKEPISIDIIKGDLPEYYSGSLRK